MQCPDAMIAIDRDNSVTDWNIAAERMFGWTRAELLSSDVGVLIPAEKLAEFRVVLGQLGRRERVVPYEAVRLHRDGSRMFVEAHAVAIRIEKAARIDLVDHGFAPPEGVGEVHVCPRRRDL